MGKPAVGEAGETRQWRTARPVLDESKCTPAKTGKPSCYRCWVYCPEAVITKEIGITIDMVHCKGCGICAEVCPAGAIVMEPETSSDDE